MTKTNSKPLSEALAKLNANHQARTHDRRRQAVELVQHDDAIQPMRDGLVMPELGLELAALDAIDRRKRGLIPIRHVNRDFFLCDLSEISIKDDSATMEAPVFSLKTQKDITEWKWISPDGKRSIGIVPSIRGRATIYDKDVLIFISSQLTGGLNLERSDAKSRKVRFVVYDYLMATNKTTGGKDYERLEKALHRLKGTNITTNIETAGVRVKNSFGLIDGWTIVEKSPTDERMIAVEVTISEWLYRAIQSHEVLTLHPDYFRLRKCLEKRLYEIARKHCGNKAIFVIGEDKLHNKSGSTATLNHFRDDVKRIAIDDNLPGYRYSFDNAKKQWIIYTKDKTRLSQAIAAKVGCNPDGIGLSGKKVARNRLF